LPHQTLRNDGIGCREAVAIGETLEHLPLLTCHAQLNLLVALFGAMSVDCHDIRWAGSSLVRLRRETLLLYPGLELGKALCSGVDIPQQVPKVLGFRGKKLRR
jgi:hypothetical protein